MFNIIWKFEVNKDHKRSFEELYGQEGKGVRLFKTGMGYIKTELLQDELQPGQYVTIDTWESQDLYERFLKENVVQFKALDQEGESLTISEKKSGWFKSIDNQE